MVVTCNVDLVPCDEMTRLPVHVALTNPLTLQDPEVERLVPLEIVCVEKMNLLKAAVAVISCKPCKYYSGHNKVVLLTGASEAQLTGAIVGALPAVHCNAHTTFSPRILTTEAAQELFPFAI